MLKWEEVWALEEGTMFWYDNPDYPAPPYPFFILSIERHVDDGEQHVSLDLLGPTGLTRPSWVLSERTHIGWHFIYDLT